MPRLTKGIGSWIVILAVALTLRLMAGFWWQSRLPAGEQFFFGDSVSYWELGKAIARGQPYAYPTPDFLVFRTPGYPLLLSGLFRIFGDDPPVIAARALSALLGTLSVGIAGWWATSLFDARAGCWAAWITALYPGAVAMGAFVLSEAPFCPWMLLQLALWGLAWRDPSPQRAALWASAGGAAGAVATLMRPSWLFFTPFALVVGLMFDRRRARQAWIGVAMLAGLALCMAPWWIRNARATGHFVPTTLQVGASLYDGLNPLADGGSNLNFVPQFAAQERAVDASNDDFEFRLDRRLRHAAIDWASAHPARAAELAGIKLARIWNVWPNEPSLRRWPLRLTIALTYAPMLGLALWGAWRFAPCGWPYVLPCLPAIYFTLLHVVFVGSIRYREPAMLALAVLAAGVVARATPRDPLPNKLLTETEKE